MTEEERERRVAALLPLVRRIAQRVHRMVPASDPGDLVGDGSIGLVRAVDSYDDSRGATLRVYAGRLILGTMLNGLRRMDPISERVRLVLRRAEHERYALAVAQGGMPSSDEMQRRHPALERSACSANRGLPLSLDAPLPLGVRYVVDFSRDPAVIAAENDERAYLRALVEALPQRQRSVVLAHYYGSTSLRRIGRDFSISSQRASQLHLAAIARLRKSVRAAPH